MSASLHREPESQGFDDASWLLIGLCLLFLIAFQLAAPFAFAANGFGGSAAMIGLLWTTDRFYTRYRVRPAFAALVTSVMLIILFSIVGGILSYLVAAQGGALWDARLQRWDLALGFDWLGYARWVNDHPTLATLYRWAYVSMIPQLLVMVLALTATNRLREMRIAICAAILAGLAAVLLSGLTPAVGNYIHLNLGPSDLPNLRPAAAVVHYADLTGLRDGSLRLIDVTRIEGIITFPSYHSALGAIFIWGFAQLGRAGWAGMLWAGLMLLATPIDGAHYLVDVLAGIALAAAALIAAGRLVRRPWLRPVAKAAGDKAPLPAPSTLPA